MSDADWCLQSDGYAQFALTGPDAEELQDVYEKLDELDETTFETRAAELLWVRHFPAQFPPF